MKKNHMITRIQTGFSLIELMVAMVIGLMIVLAATSSATFFESNRKATHGNISALENGIASLFSLQREVKNAGIFSFGSPSDTCTKIYIWNSATSAFEEKSFMPVQLGKGTDSTTPDSVRVFSITNFDSGSVPLRVPEKSGNTGNWPGANFGVSSNAIASVPSAVLSEGEGLLVVRPNGDCYVGTITNINDSAMKIQTRPSYKGASVNALPSAYDIPSGSTIYGLGSGTQADFIYSISNNNFIETSVHNSSSQSILAENIVHMRAQYGISDTNNKLTVNKWVNAGSTTATAQNIRAIRVALVARSPQKIKPSSGSSCDATIANPIVPWVLDGTTAEQFDADAEDDEQAIDVGIETNDEAKCYQYRVLTMTIPLQNFLYRGGLSGDATP